MDIPNVNDLYLDESHRGVLRRMEASYNEAITQNLAWWEQATNDQRFEAGDQTIWNELYGNLPAFKRRIFSFNRIRRIVNMIDGHQRKSLGRSAH